jgi:hypothetical protein
MSVRYEDARLTLDGDGLTIKLYYFPYGDKRLLYSEIVKVEVFDMGEGPLGGRWRIWGSGDFVHWFHFDPERPEKRTALILHKGGVVRAVITPDDPEAVLAILREEGLEIVPLDRRVD